MLWAYFCIAFLRSRRYFGGASTAEIRRRAKRPSVLDAVEVGSLHSTHHFGWCDAEYLGEPHDRSQGRALYAPFNRADKRSV